MRIGSKGAELSIEGDSLQVDLARRLLEELYGLLKEGYPLYPADIDYAYRILSADSRARLSDIFLDTIFVSARKKVISPKSLAQKTYIDAIRGNDVVFGIGPAGTGKTYLAMAMAVSFLTKKEVSRIVLVRPAVEAGEKLGFLPGDIAEKVNPYLRPLYDALFDMMDFEKGQALIEKGVVEVAPLAFMRGRTLNDAFVILDEAQNTTAEQMKMFLTRLGFGSRAVITGDITQIDLPTGRLSGLVQAAEVLKGIEGIHFNYFTDRDVVRHPIVQTIVKAYERARSPGHFLRGPVGSKPMTKKERKQEPGPRKAAKFAAYLCRPFALNERQQRYALMIGLALVLTIIIIPKGGFIPDYYTPGDIASRDIKAPKDLLIPDLPLTEKKRAEAEDAVLPLYDFDARTGEDIAGRLTQAIRKAHAGAGKTEEDLHKAVESSLGVSLSDEETEGFEQGPGQRGVSCSPPQGCGPGA